MNFGPFDRRIALQAVTVTANTSGDPVESAVTFHQPWANAKFLPFLRGRELIEAKAMYSEVSCIFTIRYSSDAAVLTSKHQILFKGVVYDILGDPMPHPAGRPEKLVIYTKARGA
jgi:SPP1 family predicted phage head-tail adaptor